MPPSEDLFDVTVFPWTQDVCREIVNRRAQLNGALFIDELLTIAGIDSNAMYPPHSPDAFVALQDAINNSEFDDVKRNCLLYYLLKAWNDNRSALFAQAKAIPRQYVILSNGYYYLDTGRLEAAVVSVCDPRVTPDFTSKILRTLATEPALDAKARSRLVLRYVRIGKPPLESQEDIECYLLALCENSSILDAWLYQRTFSEDPGHNESKGRLIDLIFDYCLYPRPRAQALKSLVAYPFTSFEHSRVVSYTLHHSSPPGTPKAATERALALLHDFIHVRLIHEGHYSEAIGLDRQFANTPFNIAGGLVSEGLESRRLGVKELLSVLPEVQRKLVDVRLESQQGEEEEARPRPTSGRTPLPPNDLTMSWEKVDASTSSLRPPSARSSLVPSSSAPLSASQAFRTSHNPRNAVLQAFASSSSEGRNAMEGSPTPTVRVGSLLAVGASPRRTASAITAPFGLRPPNSGLSRMLHVPQLPVSSASSPALGGAARGNAAPGGVQRTLFGDRSAGPSTSASPLAKPQQQLPNPFSRPADGLGAPTSGPEAGGSLFRASKPVDVDQNQRMMKKRSFGQVARSPEASTLPNPFERRNEGDMSLSELQPSASAIRGEEAEDEDSSDDDELVLNASRRSQRFTGRAAQGSRVEEPRRDTQGDREFGASEATEAAGLGSSALPGSFPTGDEDDEEGGTPQPTKKTRGGKSKVESTKDGTSGRSGSRKASSSSASANATATTTKKSTASRIPRTTGSKPAAPARASTPPTDDEPRIVRRSSRLSATPSATGGRTASPDRKKARSSAEPDLATSTTSARKSGRASTTSTRKTTGGRTASGRTRRGEVQSIVEEE